MTDGAMIDRDGKNNYLQDDKYLGTAALSDLSALWKRSRFRYILLELPKGGDYRDVKPFCVLHQLTVVIRNESREVKDGIIGRESIG